MNSDTQETHLLNHSWRLMWRSLLAALVVGTIGGGVLGVVEGVTLAVREPSLNLIEGALNGIGAGVVVAPVLWIPAWILLTAITLAWLWISGGLDPGKMRYSLAILAFSVLIVWIIVTDEASNWNAPVPFLMALIAAIGIWITVPWVLRPPQ